MTSWRQRLLSVFAVRGVRDSASESRNDETGGGPCSAEERTPLPDEMANLIARIASDNGVETEPLRTVLEKLGQLGLPHHAIPTTLDSAASGLRSLQAQFARLNDKRPELAPVRQHALALIRRGDLDGATAALNRGREAVRGVGEEAARKRAEFLADAARLDFVQLSYRASAAKYAEAAVLVEPFDREGAWRYLMFQAAALGDYGREFGDNEALGEAIAVYRHALTFAPRARIPLIWAMTQNSLGNALGSLGERENSVTRLEQAIAAYRAALLEYTRERTPYQWAEAQSNLGAALAALGKRTNDAAVLEQAVEACR